jgi:hypothetical protein
MVDLFRVGGAQLYRLFDGGHLPAARRVDLAHSPEKLLRLLVAVRWCRTDRDRVAVDEGGGDGRGGGGGAPDNVTRVSVAVRHSSLQNSQFFSFSPFAKKDPSSKLANPFKQFITE